MVLILSGFQIYASDLQVGNYNKILFKSSFDAKDNIYWQIKDQDDYKFLISQSKYLISCKKGKAISDLKFSSIPNNYLIETNLKFNKDKIEWGSAGLIFGIKGKVEGSLVVQISKKGTFRICKVLDAQTIKPISIADKGQLYGWISIDDIDYLKPVRLVILCTSTNYEVFINNNRVYRDTLKPKQSVGSVGYFIEGPITFESDEFSIKTLSESSENIKIPQRSVVMPIVETIDDSTRNVKEIEVLQTNNIINQTNSGDILKLSDAVIQLKKDNEVLKKEVSNLNIENQLLKDKERDYEEVINQFQNKESNPKSNWIVKNSELEKENEYLKNEIAELRQYKKLIQSNKDGDLLVVMTENLRKEQIINQELNKKLSDIKSKASLIETPKSKKTKTRK